MYQIKLEMFEGPFDLLLNLISRQKIDIYEIPIAKITREYLEYIETMQEFDLEVTTEFLLVAATLLDIKAANLIPKKEENREEEELSPDEAREILIARLIEYKKFKNVAIALAARYESESKYFIRDIGLEERFSNLVPDFLGSCSLEMIKNLFLSVNEKRKITLKQADHITPKPLSVDEYAKRIKERLKSVRSKTFKELTLDCVERVEIIVMFLAILELYKLGIVELGQAEVFGEIEIKILDEAEVVA